MGQRKRRRAADRAIRPAMSSPGRPNVARREDRQQFWKSIARGLQSEDAAVECGVSPAVGTRWFRENGGMSPINLAPVSGRYLSLAEREEIALLKAQNCGVRDIARRIGRDPEKVSLAYTPDSKWRNRDEFFEGREAIRDFLRRKWARELDYRLEKNLWCFTGNRIAVRFEYESHDAEGQWWRSHLYDRNATPSRPSSPGRLGPGLVEAGAP